MILNLNNGIMIVYSLSFTESTFSLLYNVCVVYFIFFKICPVANGHHVLCLKLHLNCSVWGYLKSAAVMFSSWVLIHTHDSSLFYFTFNTITGFCIKILIYLLCYLYLYSTIWYWFIIFVPCWGLNLSHLTHDVSSLPAWSCFWWHLPRSLILLIVEGVKNKIDFPMFLSLYLAQLVS